MPSRRATLLAMVGLPWTPAASAPRADLWRLWQAFDPESTARIDHSAWGSFLARHVHRRRNGANLIAYRDVTPTDRGLIGDYLGALQAVSLGRYRRSEQLAFWINLYNALAVRLVLEHYPIRSVRDITVTSPGTGRGIWGVALATVEGQPLSLDDIENRIIRPIWRDPRILYTLNCAAVGYPNLCATPYVGEHINEQCNSAAWGYVNDPRGMRIIDGRLIVSQLYRWYVADFGGDPLHVIHHLMAFAAPDLAMRLQRFDAIDGYTFDWALNDAV